MESSERKGEKLFPDDTPEVLFALADDPSLAVGCLFGDGRAVAIYFMPAGCFAYSMYSSPGELRRFQPLCAQHEQKQSPVHDLSELVADLLNDATANPTLAAGFTRDDVLAWLNNHGLDADGAGLEELAPN